MNVTNSYPYVIGAICPTCLRSRVGSYVTWTTTTTPAPAYKPKHRKEGPAQ